VLQGQMSSKIVSYMVGITAREGCTHRANDFKGNVCMFRSDMLLQSGFCEALFATKRAGERLRLLNSQTFTPVVELCKAKKL